MTHDPLNGRSSEQPRVVSENRAKQGRKGVPVLLVLLVALVLSGLAMALMYVLNNQSPSEVEPHNARQASDAEAFDRPSGDYARESLPGEAPAQNREAEEGPAQPQG